MSTRESSWATGYLLGEKLGLVHAHSAIFSTCFHSRLRSLLPVLCTLCLLHVQRSIFMLDSWVVGTYLRGTMSVHNNHLYSSCFMDERQRARIGRAILFLCGSVLVIVHERRTYGRDFLSRKIVVRQKCLVKSRVCQKQKQNQRTLWLRPMDRQTAAIWSKLVFAYL